MTGMRYRETCLIDTNLRCLGQLIELLEDMDTDLYVRAASPGGHSIGPQVRHIVEFYDAFIIGLSHRRIDYGARKRDPLIETSRLNALDRLRSLRSRLMLDRAQLGDSVVWIRVEDSEDGTYVMSSVSRELQELSSHTVHHLALIGMIASARGILVDPDLGVSPSTVAHRKGLRKDNPHVYRELAPVR
jgi:hypothetical protein